VKNEKNATGGCSNRAAGISKLIRRTARGLVAAGVLLGLPCSVLHAEVVISNLPNTVTGGSTVSNGTHHRIKPHAARLGCRGPQSAHGRDAADHA